MPGSLLSALRRTLILAELGESDAAGRAADRLLTIEPNFKISAAKSMFPRQVEADQQRILAALVRAGLPE